MNSIAKSNFIFDTIRVDYGPVTT